MTGLLDDDENLKTHKFHHIRLEIDLLYACKKLRNGAIRVELCYPTVTNTS